MHPDWHLMDPTKPLDYPDHIARGRTVAVGGDNPACMACGLGRACGARDCPNNPVPKVMAS